MDISSVSLKGPDWAHGCEGCTFGVVLPPAPIPVLPLHEQRATEAAEGLLIFCECRAGFMYRQYLRKVYARIGMESRKNLRDIVMAANVPTIHMAGEPA